MHEASIIRHVIDAVQERIDDGTLTGRILSVRLRVGLLTATVPSNLQFMFGILTAGTPLENAILEIQEVPMMFCCGTCETHLTSRTPVSRCPVCLSRGLVLVSGRELMIDSVEVQA